MNEDAARTIFDWRYPPPYDVYNPRDEEAAEYLADLLNPAFNYHVALDRAGELVGYCCYGADARVTGGDYSLEDALDIGLALRPDLTGRSRGVEFVQAVLRFAGQTFAPAFFRATIATFNLASQRCFVRAGFRTTQHFISAAAVPREYVIVVRPATGWDGVSADRPPPPPR